MLNLTNSFTNAIQFQFINLYYFKTDLVIQNLNIIF